MKTKYVIFAFLCTMVLAVQAQETVEANRVCRHVLRGRVVNFSGIPIKDVVVRCLSTNASVTTGYDGCYALDLPEAGDSVIFTKDGLATFGDSLICNYELVLCMSPERSVWLLKSDYAEKMKETAKTYYEAGLKFLAGDGTGGPDYKKAFACFYRAANMENGDAALRLAKMYDKGVGTAVDYALAAEYYGKAGSIAEAKMRLGIMYLEGTGVKQDYDKAANCFYNAKRLGDTITAPKMLEELYAKGLAKKDVIETFDVVEVNAEFPGGHTACMNWLASQVKYPRECLERGIQGRVIVSFVVNRDGSVVDVNVLRSPDPALAKEAVRVVSSMPKWEPARQGGKVVRSRFSLPLMFRLSPSKPNNN